MWNHSGMRILFHLLIYLLIQQFCVCLFQSKKEIAAYSLIQFQFIIDLLGKSISRSKMQLIL